MVAETDASRTDGSIHAAAKCGAEAQLARLLDDGAPVDLLGTTGLAIPPCFVALAGTGPEWLALWNPSRPFACVNSGNRFNGGFDRAAPVEC